VIRRFREEDAEPVWVAAEDGEVVGTARLRGSKLALGVAKRARRRG
jgi:hypothetical protein